MAEDLLFQQDVKLAVRSAYEAIPSGGGEPVARSIYSEQELAGVPQGPVAWALGVAISDLFPADARQADPTATIVRQADRGELQLWRSGIRKQLLTPQAEGSKLNLYLVETMDEVLKIALEQPLSAMQPAAEAGVQPSVSDEAITH